MCWKIWPSLSMDQQLRRTLKPPSLSLLHSLHRILAHTDHLHAKSLPKRLLWGASIWSLDLLSCPVNALDHISSSNFKRNKDLFDCDFFFLCLTIGFIAPCLIAQLLLCKDNIWEILPKEADNLKRFELFRRCGRLREASALEKEF